MKQLTVEQTTFLRKVVRLHSDPLSTYINSWSMFTREIYTAGEYDTDDDVISLNCVGTEYKDWLKTR